MLDFCYVTNYVTLYALCFSSSRRSLLSICFAWSNGPVAVAIWGWRNSLVYHSLDKVTTFAIHVSPILVSCCMRDEILLNSPSAPSLHWVGLLGYIIWQMFYLFMTEIVFRRKLSDEPNLLTSLRWLSLDTRGVMHIFVKRVSVRLGFLPDEKVSISSEDPRIKMIFVLAQFVYTCLCVFLLVPLIVSYRVIHLIWIYVVFGIAAWNGAGFYFTVFKRGDYDRAVLEGRMGLYAIAAAPSVKSKSKSSSSGLSLSSSKRR